MPAKSEKAYIAGIVDGEGYITIRRSNQYKQQTSSYRLVVGITNKFLPLLTWIQSFYGGHIYQKARRNLKHAIAWEWSLHKKENCMQFLNDVHPFAKIKKQQVELGIEFIKLGKMKKEGKWPIFKVLPSETLLREGFKNRLSIYNQRGV